MTTATLTPTAPAPVLPDLDEATSDALGNDILLGMAAGETVARVRETKGRNRALRSHTARAWTKGGSVD